MKKAFFMGMALAGSVLLLVSCGDEDEPFIFRTADPCNTWAKPGWQEGSDRVVTPELRDGNASHLTPAEIIYYSVIENSDLASKENGIFINPVLILVYLENTQLLSQGKEYGDFEMRLLQAVKYGGSVMKKYHGFYPQLVASTYQWRAFQQRGLTFEKAQALYPFIGLNSFEETYAQCAQVMNNILATDFSLYPDSQGYYRDFFGNVGIEEIQAFLEIINSPLKDDLFNQPPVFNTVINYSNMSEYCE